VLRGKMCNIQHILLLLDIMRNCASHRAQAAAIAVLTNIQHILLISERLLCKVEAGADVVAGVILGGQSIGATVLSATEEGCKAG
jgi:hypothetical protein